MPRRIRVTRKTRRTRPFPVADRYATAQSATPRYLTAEERDFLVRGIWR